MSHTVIISIPPDGQNITVKVNGIKGSKCKQISKSLTDELGEVTNDVETAEFYQRESATDTAITRQAGAVRNTNSA